MTESEKLMAELQTLENSQKDFKRWREILLRLRHIRNSETVKAIHERNGRARSSVGNGGTS